MGKQTKSYHPVAGMQTLTALISSNVAFSPEQHRDDPESGLHPAWVRLWGVCVLPVTQAEGEQNLHPSGPGL